ncbi:hypothetical protein GCM10010278_77010 [Streptomyces melanogenes]|nr:hypothetical protein GCM10010278_77010 [Streptomyces melanogenes]
MSRSWYAALEPIDHGVGDDGTVREPGDGREPQNRAEEPGSGSSGVRRGMPVMVNQVAPMNRGP